MQLPNFLGVGVQRAATTWLHDCLAEHPEIYVPPEKEVQFFDMHLERGVEWYASRFSPRRGEKAIGEITPLYLHRAPLDEIARVVPDARLLLILRDPVDRAYSAYQLFHEKLAGTSFAAACRTNLGRSFLECSHYADRLVQLFNCFPRENVKVFLYEEVQNSPANLLRQVFLHLGVDENFVPAKLTQIQNRIIFPRAQRLAKQLHLEWGVALVRQTRLGTTLKRISKNSAEKRPPEFEFRQQLRESFQDDILRTQELLRIDLSAWLPASVPTAGPTD